MINNNLSAKRIYKNTLKTMAIIMMTAAFTVSCGKKKEKVAEENLRPVKVQSIGQNTISLGYTVSGTIKGKEEIPYVATSSGEVTVVNGKNGDYVHAGQVIIAIDNQAARSNVISASSNYETARINYEKYRVLYNKRLVTETEYLNAKTNYDSARANLQTANDANSKSVIRTDVNGVLANLNIERHQQVSAGQALFTLVNESEMILQVGVSPQIVGKIQVGTTAKVKIDELNKDR